MAKYGVAMSGWELLDTRNNSSDFWKGIFSIKDSFAAHIKFGVGLGDIIFFYHDTWLVIVRLLISCVSDYQAIVRDYMDKDVSQVLWGSYFQKKLA